MDWEEDFSVARVEQAHTEETQPRRRAVGSVREVPCLMYLLDEDGRTPEAHVKLRRSETGAPYC